MSSNPEKRIVLLFAPPGKRGKLVSVVRSLVDGRNPPVFVFDLDSSLNKDLGVKTVFDLTSHYTKDYIQDAWIKKVVTLAHTISQLDKFQTFIVVSHVLYYKIFTREYFPLFNAKIFTDSQITQKELPPVTHVALIIDDIYDTFADLRNENELFSDSTFLADYAITRKLTEEQIANDPTIAFDWLNYCMSTILQWRSQEIILSQNVSTQLGAKFLLWGLKQDPNALLKWALSEGQKIFYLSHPITEPRSGFDQKIGWPALTKVINRTQSELIKYNAPIIMPTAIDELRFKKTGKNHTGFMTPRWPLPDGTEDFLKSIKIVDKDIDKIDLFAPSMMKIIEHKNIERVPISMDRVQEYANASLNTLEMQILEQLANRDHLLVWESDGIIMLEPWSIKETRIHSGIWKEMMYICDNNAAQGLKPAKRICAVFSSEALESVMSGQKFKDNFVRIIRKLIASQFKLDDSVTQILINDNGDIGERAGSMGTYVPANVVTEIKSNLNLIKDRACINAFIERALLIGESVLEYTDIIFVDKLDQIFEGTYAKMMYGFLTGGSPDLTYKSRILSQAMKNGIVK